MGSSASKGARAAGSTVRKYPARAPNTTNPASARLPQAQPSQPSPGPSVHAPTQASETKSKEIDMDARDPAFASRLNTIGVVQPNPHYSPTSTSAFDPQRNFSENMPSDMMNAPPQPAFPGPRDNPALRVLDARQRLQQAAEEELDMVGRRGFPGRTFVDVGILQLALMRRKRGENDARIEESLGIRKGRLGTLGKGIVEAV